MPGSDKHGNMDIRPIRPTELNALIALYAHLHTSDDPLPEPAVVDAVWQELMANPRDRVFGVYVDDSLVSSCALTVVPNLTRGCRSYGVIENVVTHPTHRNRGYGKALLSHALSFAWSVGCYKVMVFTGKKDPATLRFYEAAGFDRHEKQAFVATPTD